MQNIKKYLLIIFSSIMYGIGISMFLDPNNLAPGGVSGVSIIINRLFGLPTGILILLFNIPILILAIYKFGIKLFSSTIFILVFTSVIIDFTAPLGALTTDPLLAALAGGVLLGISMGLIFKSGGTTGGVDIIIKLLRLKYKHIKSGVFFLIFDGIVIFSSWLVFKNLDIALYAVLAVVIQAVVLNIVLYTPEESIILYIISDKKAEISKRFLADLNVGATYLYGQGVYSKQDKDVMLSCIRKNQLSMARQIVLEEDENAFLIVSGAKQIFGEGFLRHDREEL